MKVKVERLEFNGKQHLRVSVSTEGYEPVTLYSLLEVLKWIFLSEDLGYPNGKGHWFTLKAIEDVANGGSPSDVIKKYGSSPSNLDSVIFTDLPENSEELQMLLKNKPNEKRMLHEFLPEVD